MKLHRLLPLVIASLVLTGGLRAQFVLTTLTDLSSFHGTETVLGFNTLPNLTPISIQFVNQGVTFDSALIASTNGGDTNLFPNNADGVIATNWDASPATTWTITFDTPQVRVGFLVEMNGGDILQLMPALGSTSHGSVTFTSVSNTPVFFGVGDDAKFDTLTFTMSGPVNRFFGMDNFRYESVPEPSAGLLLGTGLVVVGLMTGLARRRG